MADQIKDDSPLARARADQYQDPEGLSITKLEASLWLAENKEKIIKGITIILMMVSVVAWGYTLYHFGMYFAVGMAEDDKMAAEIVATPTINHEYIKSITAKDLVLGGAQIISTANGKYDLVAEVQNPSPRHWANFSFSFIVDGQPTEKVQDFILPGETKKVMLLGREYSGRPLSVDMTLDQVLWSRLNQKKIPDWTAFKSKYFDIEIADKKFSPARNSGLSEKLSLSQLSFNVINKGAYNYLKVNFKVSVSTGPALIGVNQFSIDNLVSGETREVKSNFLGQFSRVDGIEIVPEVNIMDASNFLKFNSAEALPTHPVEQ